jgi:hypothetical protein
MSDIYERKRLYEDRSKQLMKLCSMPERTTSEDLRRAATDLHQASRDLDDLMNTQPKGCSCRRHEDDGRSWVTYDEQCQHHRHMLSEIKRVEAHYKDLESKLENKLRVSFFQSALQGLLAGRGQDAPSAKVIADRAMEIAEAAVARLRE